MGEPDVDASSPLLQIQFGKRWAINLFQSDQNITYLSLCMADDATIGLKAIQASPELHPHRRLPDRTPLSEEWMPLVRRSLNRAQGDEQEKPGRGDQSPLSRKSGVASRDHGHRHKSGTRHHIGPRDHRANICVRSRAPAPLLPMPPGAGFPALLPEDHIWEPSLLAPGTAVLQPFLLRVP